MVLINGVKYACERCIRGHRVTTCTHTDQPLTMIKPKGRPASQCSHCREQRKLKNLHVQCTCGKKGKSPGMHLASCLCHKNSHCTCSNSQKSLSNSGNIHHLNASERAKKKSLITAANSEITNFPSSSTFTPSLSSNYIIEDVIVPFDVGNNTGSSSNANGLFDIFSNNNNDQNNNQDNDNENGNINTTNSSHENSINQSASNTNANSINNSRTNLIDSNSNSSVSPAASANYVNINGGMENINDGKDSNHDRNNNSTPPTSASFHIKSEDINNSPNSITLRPSSSASINPHIKQRQQTQQDERPSKLDLDFKNEFDQDLESHLTPTELDLVDRMFPLFPLVGSLSFDDDKTQPLSSIPLSTPYNNDSSNSLSTPISVSNSFSTTNNTNNANPHANNHHSSITQKFGSASSTGNTSPATNNIHSSTKITKPHQPKPTRPVAIVPSTSHSANYNHPNSNSSSNVNITNGNTSTNSTNSGSHYQPIRPKRPESVLSITSNSSSRSFDINTNNNNNNNGSTQNSSINYTSHPSIIAGPGSHLANISQNPSSTFLNGNLPNATNSQAFPPSVPFPSYENGNNNNTTTSSTASSQFGGSALNESGNNQTNSNNNGNFGVGNSILMGNNQDGHYHQHPFGRIGLGSTNSSTNNIIRLDEENNSIHENDSSFNIDTLSNNGFQNGSGIDSDFMDSENWFNDLTASDNKIRRNTSLSTTSSFANIYGNSNTNPFSESSTVKRQSSLPRRSTTNGFTDLTTSNSDTKLAHSIARANTTNSHTSANAVTSTVASTTGASAGGSSTGAAAYIDNSISITPPPNGSDNELSFPPFQRLPSQQFASQKGGSISQSENEPQQQQQKQQQQQQQQQNDYDFHAPMFSDLMSPIFDNNRSQYD